MKRKWIIWSCCQIGVWVLSSYAVDQKAGKRSQAASWNQFTLNYSGWIANTSVQETKNFIIFVAGRSRLSLILIHLEQFIPDSENKLDYGDVLQWKHCVVFICIPSLVCRFWGLLMLVFTVCWPGFYSLGLKCAIISGKWIRFGIHWLPLPKWWSF